MDLIVTEEEITARTIEKVIVHPLVLRNIVEDYNRVAKNSGKRVVGVLLGSSSRGIVEVVNSYTVPFKEDDKDCDLDHRSMLRLLYGINDMVGWYSTCPELRENDLDLHVNFCSYVPNPVLVVIDVGLGIPTNAYYTKPSLEKIEKVFISASIEIAPHAVKEYLLSELKDTNTPKRMTLGGVSFVDAMESYMELYKNQVRISVEGYDISLQAVDLDISLVNHFSSCGNVEFVEVPRDPVTNAISGTSTTVVLRGEGAEEKALALNGSDLGGWRVSVKILPQVLSSLRSGLTTREAARQYVAHFKRYKSRGITVKGYDRSLCEAHIKRALVNHFSPCGEITDVFVFKRRALVYFFEDGAVGKALKLCRSQRRERLVTGTGFRARAMPIPKRLVVHGPNFCLDSPAY
ncbi:hypothetical protein Bca4012_016587 [Brassica carinata]